MAATLSFDPFIGSGPTLIAADKTGRACRGVELVPPHVDVILRRYEAATGNPAFLIETGVAFGPLALRRASEAAPVKAGPGARALGSNQPLEAAALLSADARTAEVRGANPRAPNLISHATG